MHDTNFILREALLDPTLKVVGYELSWQSADGYLSQPSERDLQSMIAFVGERLTHAERGYLLAGTQLFVAATPETLRSGLLQKLSPKDTVLTIQRADLGDASAIDDIKAARAAGFGILLRDADLGATDQNLLPLATHVEQRSGSSEFAALATLYPSLVHVARGIHSWEELDASLVAPLLQ